jgi:sulfite reductase (ferredoxin)
MGDLTSDQLRVVAELARRYVGVDNVRLTVEQNIVFRWVAESDLPDLYSDLRKVGLGLAGAATMADVTACPGTDTCKLGISSSRGLAVELSRQLGEGAEIDPALRNLRIKTSGCFNSCGQHHIADLGFLGVSRNVAGRRVPHFQVVLGGEFSRNAASYGLALGAVPSKNVPDVMRRLTGAYLARRHDGETFQDFIKRSGKAQIKEIIGDLVRVPTYEEDPSFYTDWGDPREYSISDMGDGECAGEVVSAADFGLAEAEREAFEAQLKLDGGDPPAAAKLAWGAMLQAAKTLIKVRNVPATDDASVVEGFREHLHETRLFSDPFAGDKFAQYFFRLSGESFDTVSQENAHRCIQEAQLFVDAAHACYERLLSSTTKAAT